MNWTPLIFFVSLAVAILAYAIEPLSRAAILVGVVSQIIALFLAAYNTGAARNAYGYKDEPRSAWFTLSLGLWIWVLGQFLESYCDLVLEIISYGTVADAFWTLGYFPLVIGVWKLVNNYRHSGLPLGSRASYVLQFAILIALYCTVFYIYLLPQVTDPERSGVFKFLDLFYSGMDFILICLCSVLIRISWMLRGGSLARSWILLCLGFIMVGVADLWLSYSTDFNSRFYRVNDAIYFTSYYLIALAGMYQVRMLKTA